jgi:hypothetical protein
MVLGGHDPNRSVDGWLGKTRSTQISSLGELEWLHDYEELQGREGGHSLHQQAGSIERQSRKQLLRCAQHTRAKSL